MKISRITSALAGVLMLLTSCGGKETCNATCDNTQAVIDNIMTRTSIRQFTDQPIGADTLETILKAGMAAPTAVNKQPWAFVTITERAQLDTLNAYHPYARLATATTAIVVCGDMNLALEGPAQEYWIQDCSAASENILLATHAFGLGAVWCGVYPDSARVADVSRVLGLPSTIIPLNIITMGHPDVTPEPKDKWMPEKVHSQKW
ncbi:MAG: nitroreductase family protein [Bacteroidales bacterium]|nr:nitroreductase family protein [Bacteroidales bacterium]